jgi:hypothetical protein
MGRSDFHFLCPAGVYGCTDSINRKRRGCHHSCADCIPDRARKPRGSKAFHGGIGHLHFNVVLHARRPRDHHAGDGARPIPFQALPFHRQWNGRHRLAAHHVRDPASLEVLIRCKCGTCHARAAEAASDGRFKPRAKSISPPKRLVVW